MGQVHHGSAPTTAAVRRAIQHSQESLRALAKRYGDRYAYGHIVEHGKHLIVSGGLGCSIAPVRVGVTPEILLIELGDAPAA